MTEVLDIGVWWVQISDGTAIKTMQVLDGEYCYLFSSTNQPAMNETGHLVNDFMTITPPTIAWIRATGGTSNPTIKVAIT